MTIKKLILQLHLWLGLTSGLVVFIVAITGALYVFEEEGRELFQHQYYHVHVPENATRLPLTQLVDSFRAHSPKEKIASIRWKESKDAAVIFFTKNKLVSIDPYTGSIAGVRNVNGDFFTVVLKIHRELLLDKVGKQIIRWNVLIFFIMCISGLVLWWPRQRRFFKQAVTINFKARSWKRVNWDLHRVLGFYALLVLLIISLTGLFWTFDTAKGLVAFITRSPVPEKEARVKAKPLPGRHFTLDEAYSYAAVNYPGAQETFIAPPADSTAPIRIIMRYPYTLVRKQNTFLLSPYNGKLLKADLYTNYTAYDKVARSNYDLHTGRIQALGIGSKIIWFLAALMAASLPVTGFLIWWGRRRKKPLVRLEKAGPSHIRDDSSHLVKQPARMS
jgi:uncharacterized iron-regulated membrane protein